MLSAFPQLFVYSPLAIAGLRIFFGLWFLTYGYSTLFKKTSQEHKKINLVEQIISGLALVVGLATFIGVFTQIAVLVGLLIIVLGWYTDVKSKASSKEFVNFGFYIAIIGIALLFLGPGVLAIDLPL